jgi:hypothetical protein
MTLPRFTMPAVLAGIAIFLASSPVSAVTTTKLTLPAGTKFTAVLHKGIDSRTLTVGSNFVLHIDEPTQPALDGATIHGHVTDVAGPTIERAHIGFVFDYIKFQDGSKEPIHVAVLSKNVTQTNTATAQKEAAKFKLPPMLPVGTVTPGPIAWQMTFRPGQSAPSITPGPSGLSGGTVYASNSNENIVIPPGTPVTMQLTNSLAVP